MIAYGMLYAGAVGVPIFLAAIACAAVLRRSGRPERGVWVAALALALTLPAVFLLASFGGGSEAPGTLVATESSTVAIEALRDTGVLGLPTVVVLSLEESGPGLDDVLVLGWLLASAVLMLRWMLAAFRLARASVSWRFEIVDGIRVWLTEELGPAVCGVVRNRILVPSWLLSMPREQRSLVLLHEQEHVRARDSLLMAVSRLARIVAPWNPVVWLLSSRLLDAIELDCDRRVLGRRPDIETYGDTLLTVSAKDSGTLVAAAAFVESRAPLRRRIVAMTTPPRAVSALGVLTVLTLAAVLLMGSCEVPVPLAVNAERQDGVLGPESREDFVRVSIERDGSVYVNDEPRAMEEVSDVVAALDAASEGRLVISIVGDSEVPYRFMQQLQQELVEGGVVRVVFQAVDSLPAWSPPDDVADLVSQGQAIVLPERSMSLPEQGPPFRVSQRNLLHLTVQPSGVVEMRRGASQQISELRMQELGGLWLQEVALNPDLIAAVRFHPDAPHRLTVDVLDALHSANAERISLQMLEN